jgi:hypothetical protein
VVNTIRLAFGLFGAVVASQGPEFTQQYRQRLGGAIDELKRVVQQVDEDAQRTGQTREGAIGRMAGDPNDFTRLRAEAARSDIERLERLERQRQGFEQAGPLTRVLVFARDLDAPLASRTYDDFVPAVPTTEAGLLSAAFGFVGGWALLYVLVGLIRTLFGRRTRARGTAVAEGRTA